MESKHWLSNGALFLIHAVANVIAKDRDAINSLNLFPVPDGDTGTNLQITLEGIANDIAKLPRKTKPKLLLQELARSANMSAHGNSGTILAGIVTGIVETLEDTEELTPQLLAEALENANIQARTSVRQPTEGTMLTVIRDMSIAARAAYDNGATTTAEMARPILLAAKQASDESAEIMRKILQRENVGRDAGASALALIVEEAIRHMVDKIDDLDIDLWEDETPDESPTDTVFPENAPWEPGTPLYCTEFVLSLFPDATLDTHSALEDLAKFGNSEIYNTYRGIAKAHVHSDYPWKVLEHFAQYGEIAKAKIEDMKLQTEQLNAEARAAAPRKPLGVIVVTSGEGIRDFFATAGVDRVVDGGQSNNPAVGDIYDAICQANADHVIVLPGNKNILATAERACQLAQNDQGIVAAAIPTMDIPQNVAALLEVTDEFGPDDNFTDLCDRLTHAALAVRSASVTKAVKDYSDSHTTVAEGQLICLINDKIQFAGDNIIKVITDTIKALTDESTTLIIIYLGKDFTASEKRLRKEISKLYCTELEIIYAGQPIYHAVISVC